MQIVGERLRILREGMKLSQMKLGKLFGVGQASITRYERGESSPTFEILLKYADYFDVSMDYIFGRTDNPRGMAFDNVPKIAKSNPEMEKFVEMCFDPASPMNAKLKLTLVRMLSEEETT